MTGTSSRTSASSILALGRSRETLLNPPCLGGTFCFWGFPKSPFLFAVELHSFLTTPVPSLLRMGSTSPLSFLPSGKEKKQEVACHLLLGFGIAGRRDILFICYRFERIAVNFLHLPSYFFHQTFSKTFPHEGSLESVLFSESSLSLRVRSSLRNEIRDAVEAERVLRVIPKIGQTCPELRTVFALSLCFVSLSRERNEKESLLMVRRGRGRLSLAAQLQKKLWFFSKKNNRMLGILNNSYYL